MLQLDLNLVVARLDQDVPGFVTVGRARDLGAAQSATIRYPSAWVVLLGETGGDPKYFSGDFVDQTVVARVGIIMAVRDIADTTGAQAGTDLAAIRSAVLLSLCRFVPEADGQAFRFASGRLQSGIGRDGAMFWQDDFTLRFERRIQIS